MGSCLTLLMNTCVLSQARELSAAEALQRHRESLSYLQSVSMKIQNRVNRVDDSVDPKVFPQTSDFVFRQDVKSNRAEWVGKHLVYDSTGELNQLVSSSIKDIADGNMLARLHNDFFNFNKEAPRGRFIVLRYNYKEKLKEILENPNSGGPLFGKMYGSNYKSVADLLGESTRLHILDKKEKINGVACFVLEGKSKYGKVTAWVAPEKGYNAMKWVIQKDPHHLFNDAAISKGTESWQVSFNVKELHEVIGEDKTVFVPKRAHFSHTINFRDGTKNIDHYEYKTSDIKLKPDFEALGAFKMDFPDGIRVFNKDFPGARFKWENGKPVRGPKRGSI